MYDLLVLNSRVQKICSYQNYTEVIRM